MAVLSATPTLHIVTSFQKSLHQLENDAGLGNCDQVYIEDLNKCASIVARLTSSSEVRQLLETGLHRRLHKSCNDLIAVCNDKFKVYPYNEVPRCWRALYTAASLLSACTTLVAVTHLSLTLLRSANVHTEEVLAAVQKLDLAIIVAGAPGTDVKACIQDTIRGLQRCALLQDIGSQARDVPQRPSKKRRVDEDTSKTLASSVRCRAAKAVPEVSALPWLSGDDPRRLRPFIVRGFAEDWPASIPDHEGSSRVGRWADGDYLGRIAGPGRVVPVEVGGSYTAEDWSQGIVGWETFLESSGWHLTHGHHPVSTRGHHQKHAGKQLYLAQHQLVQQFPSLLRDIITPDIVHMELAKPPWMPGYQPPLDADGNADHLTNVWIGPEGTNSPAHTDPYYNCYIQVVGRKAIWLAPPDSDEQGGMQTFGSSSARIASGSETERAAHASPMGHISKADPSDDVDEGDDGAAALMTNTSRVDVFHVEGDAQEVTYPPAFKNHVEPRAMHAILEPGDLLFMPPGWWHAMRSLSRSFSVSMWF
ncbi:Clavaminate synthase-like protein [Tilletiaria anomala UBC 951]|uniref:Clavaminate synthase-like protein n=1 Tax=Tilletiaria anomala (strain ATCC 24038 / CBS 436.72 / UBC 951) TaxID=1037660 RepID=A0A066W6Y6_TILAU|nr:Clavaminate synthase-like protein [Tilletiaria anomala UBC 951]KDN46824.1 Clavaminate synthase-like protein [Tilletiaria anomala UBC 951]